MAYTTPEIRQFSGLYLQQNSFQVPDGGMEEAKNVVIRSDDVITKTYGYYRYWQQDYFTYGSPVATYTFQGMSMIWFETGLAYFEDTYPYGGTFNAVGSITYTTAADCTFSTSMNFIEQNSNLYFTTLNKGIAKLENFDDFTVQKAGVPPALGLDISYFRYGWEIGGVLKANSQTAFRVVFGRRDSHGNLLLGAPSDVLTIGVPAKKVGLTYIVDSGLITIAYPDNYFLQNYKGQFGQVLFNATLSNATNPVINSLAVGIIINPGVDLTFTTGAPDGTGTVDVSFEYQPSLVAQIPSEIPDGFDYFVQLYKSSPSLTVETTPFPDFKLAIEQTLTTEDIQAGEVLLVDTIDPLLLGAELYTNPNTREGPLQENSRPPQADFMALYKNYAAFAKIKTVQRMGLNLANPETLDTVVFQSGVTQESYRAVDMSVYEPGNVNSFIGNITSLSPLTIEFPFNHTFPVGSKIQVSGSQYGGVVPGEYTVTSVSVDGVVLNTTSTDTGDIYIQVVSDGTSRLFNGYESEGWTFNVVSEWTEFVARDLVRAINGNPSSFMYANYISSFDDFPGGISIQSKEFIDPIYMRYGSAPAYPPFIQNIPNSFGVGVQYYSDNDDQKNRIYFSKVGEPEAVPVINFFPVGSASAGIVGIFATRDSLIVLKEDGVYRVVGDVIDNFSIQPLDLTIQFFPGMGSVGSRINNTVIAFCNQGVVQITDSSVQVISRRIEDVIQPLIGRDLSKTFLFGHESERLFYVQTEGINPGSQRTTWIYNVLNQTWTNTDRVFNHLSLDAKNAQVGITTDSVNSINIIWKQRRTNTRVDWCGEYATGTIITDTALYPDKTIGVFTLVAGNDIEPEKGDVILVNNVFNRIMDVVENVSDYTITFVQPVSYAKDVIVNVVLYKGYESRIKFAPFHAGQVSRSKHFAQMQIHLRQQVLSDLTIDFAGGYFNNSEKTEWSSFDVQTTGANGWGSSPWGIFPWGLTDGSNLKPGTESAAIIRTYVPRFAARNTFIQPSLTHGNAAQPMYIQALSYSIHAYLDRTSK